MFYKEALPNNVKSNLRVKITNFSQGIDTVSAESTMPLYHAVSSFNFDFNSGALKDGLGLKELSVNNGSMDKTFTLPENVKAVRFWQFNRYDIDSQVYAPLLMMLGDDNVLYYARLYTNDIEFHSTNLTFNTIPECINYRLNGVDVFLICVPGAIYVFDGVNPAQSFTSNVPTIVSACLYAGRLFASTGGDGKRLYFSDDLDPTNWDISDFEGGYIEFDDPRGAITKIIETGNYLYLIREYGITRVSAWGMQDDFNTQNLYLTTGKIYGNSATLCGNIIIMLGQDGLYYFNGSSIKKLELGLDNYFKNVVNNDACSTFLDGKYYLSCNMDFGDNLTVGSESTNYPNNALIEFDINNNRLNILRGVSLPSLYAYQTKYDSKLVACMNGLNGNKLFELTTNGKIMASPTYKLWQSPLTDMGYPSYKKVLKNIYINTSADITITIKTEKKSYSFKAKGGVDVVKVPLNIVAQKFSFTFICEKANVEISNPQLEVSLC